MITEAGTYNVLFTWMAFSTTFDPTFGQASPNYTPKQSLYGYLQGETFANPSPQGSQSRATIHIRGLPAMTASDQLYEVTRGYTWRISGVREDVVGNEMVFEVFR